MNRATHLEAASAKGRLQAHATYLRTTGRSLLLLAHQAAPDHPATSENDRTAREAAVGKFLHELDQRIDVSLAQAASIPQAVNKQAFAATVHGITQEYMRAVVAEASRLLKLSTAEDRPCR